jgi:hypothetical protein
MLYIQVAAAVVGLILGLVQMTKESAPYIQQRIEQKKVADIQAESVRLATEQSQMQLDYQYRGNDGTWRYYSDPTNNFWVRVNINGVQEYARNPQLKVVR